MQLKLKLAAISSVVALAVGLGVALAGPAAAEGVNVRMCVTDSQRKDVCAETFPTKGDDVTLTHNGDTGEVWDTPGEQGQISVSTGLGSRLCMQIHTGDTIWLNYCQGKESEDWAAVEGAMRNSVVFESVYDPTLCLNADPYIGQVTVAKCSPDDNNTNQEWRLNPVP
jgi:hypothetical protein